MKGKELFKKMTNIDDELIEKYMDINTNGNIGRVETSKKPKKFNYIKWLMPVACITLIVIVSSRFGIFNPIDEILQKEGSDKDELHREVVVEFNNKLYSVIYSKNSIAYDNYNLEDVITSDLLGDYIGECLVRFDSEGGEEWFKLYRYVNAPITEYDWVPRMIIERTQGEYYHALIGSCFDDDSQSADEILSVYGMTSPDTIVSIENKKGKIITDREFISEFYNGLVTEVYGDGGLVEENVYQNSGIDESEIDELYCKYADDLVALKVTLANGLVIGVDFTSHNYVEIDNYLFFEVEDSWLDLVSVFR